MLIWVLYFLLSLIFMVVCYVTNPIVVLFCNEDGELPGWLKYWQTWDNSCDPSEIQHIAPSWLQYGWADHYREYEDTNAYLRSVNRKRWYTVCYNCNFTLIERLKRYACRVLWLTRNCSYGFSFYLLGLTVSPNLTTTASNNTLFVREKYGNGLFGAWMYRNNAEIFTVGGWTVRWNNLLGWKIDTDAKLDTRAMIANRIAFSFRKEG